MVCSGFIILFVLNLGVVIVMEVMVMCLKLLFISGF